MSLYRACCAHKTRQNVPRWALKDIDDSFFVVCFLIRSLIDFLFVRNLFFDSMNSVYLIVASFRLNFMNNIDRLPYAETNAYHQLFLQFQVRFGSIINNK